MNEQKTIYELYIDAGGCYFEIFVNEVPIYFHYEIGATAFRLPINSYIAKSGEQTISFKMLSVAEGKPFPQGTDLSLTIDEYPKDQPRDRKTIFTYKTPIFEESNKGVFIDEKIFKAEVPYRLTDWKQGVDLSKEKKETLRNELEEIYNQYTLAFKNNDLSTYKELTKIRQEDTFTSLYYDENERKLEEVGYLDGITHEKVKLYPIDKKRYSKIYCL